MVRTIQIVQIIHDNTGRNALVTMRNGAFYLLCRVGDLRPTHLIESHISAYVVRREETEEGEHIPHHLYSIGSVERKQALRSSCELLRLVGSQKLS